MSDLVKRLREFIVWNLTPDICNEAADEIERLTAELAERPDHRAVMKQALEALVKSLPAGLHRKSMQDHESAITALRNALKGEV